MGEIDALLKWCVSHIGSTRNIEEKAKRLWVVSVCEGGGKVKRQQGRNWVVNVIQLNSK